MEILVVEDDFISRSFLQKIIESSGHKAVLAENGMKAWELLKTNNLRMVITDWMMPEMDGLALCRKIRAAGLPSYIYIILVTSKEQKEDAIKGLGAGADDYIAKPFDPDELMARVRSGERIIQLEEEQKKAHIQVLHSEKMASIGQLAAGVAHEINNPTAFVDSNLRTLSTYQDDINMLIREYRKLTRDFEDSTAQEERLTLLPEQVKRILAFESEVDIDFILKDISDLIEQSLQGTERIKKIVIDLKDFAHPGEDELKYTDIHKCLDTTLNIVWNELKYKATVIRDYGDIPEVKCYPRQLSQVFMNILVNAAQAIEDKGEIKIATKPIDRAVEIAISDTGVGIPKENLSRIFEAFFTTKKAGKGTGLGLSLVYSIIKKHNGTIDVESTAGKGTKFTLRIPVDEG
ncbi:MAG: response regulator [Thermodesulfobacteriota bacterium]